MDNLLHRLDTLLPKLEDSLRNAMSQAAWEAAKAEIFGPSGDLTVLVKELGQLPKARRPELGRRINEVKDGLQRLLDASMDRIAKAEREKRLGQPPDPTLTSPYQRAGHRHPLSLVRDRIVEIFRRMGFSVASATEVETEWACFDALNIPASHAARDTMDTFFLPDECAVTNVQKHGTERYLLRTHMTTVQIRTMETERLPLRIVAPGRVFRRDTVDATHSANFHQCDVVHVDRGVSVADLKATIEFFCHNFFGADVEMRYRPSFFPFTEPSFEVDMRCPNLGKLSNTWVEMWGCGIIHPKVFANVGIDPVEWSGQAWGIGIERVAMMLFGIDDVRHFYRNDIRFLRQFG
ncbi:MAG: phenylalanine--tRNA ligase subunit alpha [Puniceicoccales bacterium]|jgi:phenylalanyl-tRNA synthetase alpha chain|nr:phenylalanine--tRNA ligase subunit alpha [Puniceicoccales bacterium]